jgi:flagellar protein FliS
MGGIAAYRENSVTTQPKGRLVVMLYEGAIKFLRQAMLEMDRQDPAAKGQFIVRALDVITELDCSLDMEAGGEIAKSLRSLYAFMRRHLCEANIHQDARKIQDVIRLLEDLLEAWRVIAG